ncbi:hypothetical protein EVAR_62522_1 [Eumeta japonica]|uniref:Uncharacterized protein n=1 Tax=Eumeta variegata TaxID=151549 RepID=A0A4C1ZI83_EUMVA|nr:hypothetical protein EVAR_62522_1 [Eumeta japonica]
MFFLGNGWRFKTKNAGRFGIVKVIGLSRRDAAPAETRPDTFNAPRSRGRWRFASTIYAPRPTTLRRWRCCVCDENLFGDM